MPRSVNAVASKARRKRVLKAAKGYYGKRKNVYTVAKNVMEKGLTYSYVGRKNKAGVPCPLDCPYKCRSKRAGNYIQRTYF